MQQLYVMARPVVTGLLSSPPMNPATAASISPWSCALAPLAAACAVGCHVSDEELAGWRDSTEGLALLQDQGQEQGDSAGDDLGYTPVWQSVVPARSNLGLVEALLEFSDGAPPTEVVLSVGTDVDDLERVASVLVEPGGEQGGRFVPFEVTPLIDVVPGRVLFIQLEAPDGTQVWWRSSTRSTYAFGQSYLADHDGWHNHDMTFRTYSWVAEESL